MAPVSRDVDKHLVSKVEVALSLGGVIERAPDKVEQIAQGFEGIVDRLRWHDLVGLGFLPPRLLAISRQAFTRRRRPELVIARSARELGSDLSYLQNLADGIEKDLVKSRLRTFSASAILIA
jgi:hypothetical protein